MDRDSLRRAGSGRGMTGGRRPRLPAALVPLALLAGAWTAAALPGRADAREAGPAAAPAAGWQRYDIAPGALRDALAQFGRQSGVMIGYDGADVDGRTSPGLAGSYAPGDALRALLAGTGLAAAPDGSGGYTLRRQQGGGPVELEVVRVTGQSPATTEGTGSYTSGVVTVGKGEQSLREIPQSVSVLTRKRMEDQGIADVRQALTNLPGITMVANEPGGHAYSRGFLIESYQFDGVPLERQLYARGSAFNADMAIFDRVEVLRSPQGMFEGAGTPSGAVNLVRKRPTGERQIVLTGKAGSWDEYGAQLDAGGPLNEAGTLRGRFVADYGTADSFRDYIEQKTRTVYGALDFDLARDTTLGVGFSREKPKGVIDWGGLPGYANGDIPDYARSTNLSAPWNHARKTQDTWYVDFSHRFNDRWKIKAALAYVDETNDIKYLLRSGTLGPPNTFRGDAYYFDMTSRNLGADVYVTGSMQVLGRELDLTLGANVSRQKSTDIWGWKSNIESLNGSYDQRSTVAEPSNAEILATNRMDDGYRSRKKGAYAVGRYALAEPLSLVLGGRLSSFEQVYVSDGIWGYSESRAEASSEFTPFAGLVYELGGQWSAYASYADIFKPQTQRDVSGSFLEPVTGRNYELGLKGELLGGRLNAAFALFQTTQKNVAYEDGGVPQEVADARCGGTCFRPSAEVRSRGFEAEASGEVAPGLQLWASYTYTAPKNRGSDVPSVGYDISANTGVPRHVVRVWADYRLPAAWNRLSVGGGFSSQSRSSNFAYYGREQGGYTVWNARVAYDFNKNLSAALNVANLTDKKYFSSISYDDNFYGAPRAFLLTVQYRL